jgi:hypothetical protein
MIDYSRIVAPLTATRSRTNAACRREVAEELGLDRPVGRVLVVDWVPSQPERPEGLIVVYDGGVLAPGEVAAITTQDGELAGYAFVKPDEVAERVSPLLARRIAACLDAVVAGTVISLEGGCPVEAVVDAVGIQQAVEVAAAGAYHLQPTPR